MLRIFVQRYVLYTYKGVCLMWRTHSGFISLADDAVPEYMHMLRHPTRMEMMFGPHKSVYRTIGTNVYAVGAHIHRKCLKSCPSEFISPRTVGYLAHFRFACGKELEYKCKDRVSHTKQDGTILRFRDGLLERAEKTMTDLGFLSVRQGVANDMP